LSGFGKRVSNIAEELALSETEKETAHGVKTKDTGVLSTLGTLVSTDRKSRMMMINLNRLAPYQGAARDEYP
jgi:hypothetical protein